MEKTNEALAMEAQGGGAPVMHALWDRVSRYVAKLAYRWTQAFYQLPGVTIDDLINSGYIAMVEAVETYSSEKGAFLTWFTFYLKKAFLECYGLRRKQPDPLTNAVSLDSPISEEDGDGVMYDIVADPAGEVPVDAAENEIYLEQLHEAMEDALAKLPDVYSVVLRERYYQGKTYREIGQAMSRSASQISVLERQALRRLQGSSSQRLAEFYDFNFFRGVGLGSFRQRGTSIQERYLILEERLEKLLEDAEECRDFRDHKKDSQNLP